MSEHHDAEAAARQAQQQEFARVVSENSHVALSCDCGWSWEGPSKAVEWITDRHAHAHNKGAWRPGKEGIERLPATGRMEVRPAAELEAER